MLKNLSHLLIIVYLLFSGSIVFAKQPLSEPTMIENILDFWFDYEHHKTPIYNRGLWWGKNPDVDRQIKDQFGTTRSQVIAGMHDDWLNSPRGTLAYILLIDQFSRNISRDSADMFLHDPLALKAAQMAVSKGFDQALSLTERVFIYLPFEHAEQLEMQEKSIMLFEALVQSTPESHRAISLDYLSYAKAHKEVIDKFARFPHRNKILSRTSSDIEEEFMKTHKGF